MIILPPLFEKKLGINKSLAADVRKSLDLFEPWLEQSGMPFFPGFTDHSPRHVNEVLTTAEALISDSGHELLSSEDVAVLVLGILLHDCGMHLTQDGFRALIANDEKSLIDGLGDMPWKKLWQDFFAEAQRFGEERLIAVFGDSASVLHEKFDLKNLSERDCLLVGEFVRRHHARLAHEIAINGVPTTSETRLQLVGLDSEFKDIAGLCARSHGMAIRSTFEYLKKRYDRVPEYRQIKAPFLMAVLRIADYVQVNSERALKTLLSVKELRSPVSRQEWRNHFSVRDVTLRHEDPEAMYVHARPADVRTFLKLQALFKDIQRELDMSWATLGEVYGQFGKLNKLGITVRRIRSNLDDVRNFAATVSYVPVRAGLKSSGPDLLKLLVGPLYDYKFEIGIRELVQNAVDACKEKYDLLGPAQSDKNVPDVLVEFQQSEDGTGWITVSDNGIGMTQDTVVNYFLVAGASFRNSDAWKAQHVDDEGQPRVLRGGRFGVGALAAFLLGDEMTVRTRHVNRPATDGFEFKVRMDDPIVELQKSAAPPGTSIRIWVSRANVFEKLRPFVYVSAGIGGIDSPVELTEWREVDWFAQTNPSVEFRWDGYSEDYSPNTSQIEKIRISAVFKPTFNLVPNDGQNGQYWHSLPDPAPYQTVLWQYPVKRDENVPDQESNILSRRLTVINGIHIRDDDRWGNQYDKVILEGSIESNGGPEFSIARPSLSISDPLGLSPINLQRSSIAFERMNIDAKLTRAILKQYLVSVAALLPKSRTLEAHHLFCEEVFKLPGVRYEGQLLAPVCASSEGFFLATRTFFSTLGITTLFLLDATTLVPSSNDFALEDGEAVLIRRQSRGEQSELGWFRGLFAKSGPEIWRAYGTGLPDVSPIAAVGYVSESNWSVVSRKGKVSQKLLSNIRHEPSSHGFVRASTGDENVTKRLNRRLEKLFKEYSNQTSAITAWALEQEQQEVKTETVLHDVWVEKFGSPFVKPD